MTEDEMKTKWCPYARVQIDDDVRAPAVNRYAEDYRIVAKCRCIGSQCAGWRWSTTPHQASLSDGMAVAEGYCGPAGKP